MKTTLVAIIIMVFCQTVVAKTYPKAPELSDEAHRELFPTVDPYSDYAKSKFVIDTETGEKISPVWGTDTVRKLYSGQYQPSPSESYEIIRDGVKTRVLGEDLVSALNRGFTIVNPLVDRQARRAEDLDAGPLVAGFTSFGETVLPGAYRWYTDKLLGQGEKIDASQEANALAANISTTLGIATIVFFFCILVKKYKR